MQKINSSQNPIIKTARSLHDKKNRKKTASFLLEGKTLILEALQRRVAITHLFSDDERILKAIYEQVSRPESLNLIQLSPALMKKISSTETACDLVAIAQDQRPPFSIENFGPEDKLFLYCEDIQDPGNLGSLIRSAFAANASAVFLSENCADIFNPKVLRSSMGAIFAGPVVYKELPELIRAFPNIQTVGSSPRASVPYSKLDTRASVLLLVGNEVRGLSESSLNQCSDLVKIPMHQNIESINVLAAASIILFELNKKLWN
jgi:TrmH family RNA methyltransferase